MTPLSFSMLRMLSDGRFHSGEALARSAGVSRGSIWNAAKSIEEAGLELARVKGRGYRLDKPMDWLDGDAVAGMLDSRLLDIEIVECIDSTSTELLRRSGPHGKVIAAEMQTMGRGRMGRQWMGAPGGSLTFSLAWKFDKGAGFLSGLSLAVGVALARAMRACGVDDISLKWPNDVLYHFHKLAGILIEVKGDMLGPTLAVIGIGINFRLPDKTREGIDQAVIDIESMPVANPGRNRLFASILNELCAALRQFDQSGFSSFKEEWSGLNAYSGRRIRLKLPSGGIAEGIAAGVSEHGEILLDAGGERLAIASGEVSLRGAS